MECEPERYEKNSFGVMAGKIAVFVVRIYKTCISPLLGAHCRFTPTCSSYALCAFERYGFLYALLLVCKRILKCHPFHPGGYDPL